MSVSALTWAFEQKIPPATHKLVLLTLAWHADKDTSEAWPSIRALRKETHLNQKTIQESLNHLRKLGLIEDTGKRLGKTNSVPVYLVKHLRNRSTSKIGAPPILPSSTSENGGAKHTRNRVWESTVLTDKEKTVGDNVGKRRSPKRITIDVSDDEGFVAELQKAFPHLDIDTEFRKMKLWQKTPRGKGKILSRQRVLNWCSRCDKPVEIGQRKKSDPLAGLTAEEKASGGFYE